MDRGLVTSNPTAGLRRRHNYQPRDVVLTPAQLRRLWRAIEAGDAPMSIGVSNIVRLAALTGQRRAEIAGLRQSDIEWTQDAPCLTIARARAKNHNEHRVPLSRQAYGVCCAARMAASGSEFLFPGPDGTSIHPRSVSKAMERTRVCVGLGNINIHDLRRTVGSLMTKYGVPKDVRERVLNHGGKRTSSVTESVYSWYDYDPEKRAALELWADVLEAIIGGIDAELADYPTRLARIKGSAKVLVVGEQYERNSYRV
ncbi:site-specific integrase [Filomicrobium sp.]|uniref:site-specific integrase n=1 Tax=Filomicrobium sp. TaxID=2024831 RepID=UPI0025841B20|nr:site-specific integrase [Filomicrobium sp.]MCV0369653.1 site-specific integrase [Filomicrobium sp.]